MDPSPGPLMWKNYLVTAYRALVRQKGHALLNIAGLALGMAACLLIFQYVAFETSFDRFHENAEALHRITWTRVQNEGDPITEATTGQAWGPALAQEVPEVVRFARLHPEYLNAIVSNPAQPDRTFEEEQIYYADPAFFEMFSYPLVEGALGQVLSEPGTVVLSESAARKYFGNEAPVGQVLAIEGWIGGTFRVAGVFEDVPANSHLQFDLLLPVADLLQSRQYSDPSNDWGLWNFITYVQLRDDADLAEVERKFTGVLMRHREEIWQSDMTAYVDVQPLRDIHLNEDVQAPKAVMGSYRAVYFFALIGLVTLLIALVNYVNLATARALGRAREVGVRKANGAQRGQLVMQFLFESALTNAAALALALGLAAALRPVVSDLVGVSLAAGTSGWFWGALLIVFGVSTVGAGLYPAFVLSSFRPVAALKGEAGTGASQLWLRRGLVVFQFAASVALLAGTAVVYSQLGYMRSMDLGMELEQVLTVPAPRMLSEEAGRADAVETLRQELRRLSGVRQTATSFTVPGEGFAWGSSTIRKTAADPSTEVNGVGTWIDTSFARLYGLELVAGEEFERISFPMPEGESNPVVINETAARAVGFDTPADALDQELTVGRVVGVFKDFNWSSAHAERENVFFFLERGNPQVSIQVDTEDLPQTLAAIEQVYARLFPDDPFRYEFVDEQFAQQYRSDQRFARLFGLFAGLAILIACLGLFGLASFSAQRRTKEIGIRKVLGASAEGIVVLLAKDFAVLVGVAFAVGAPLAYVVMQRWLEGFAFRIDLGAEVFLGAGAATLAIALLTVSVHALRAALADPTQALRHE